MRKKLFTFLLAVTASVGTMFAEPVQIGDLYYNLDATNQTAEVTYQYQYSSNNYSGLTAANIPASVVYNEVVYSVTSIGNNAFEDCRGLTSVTIPNSVTSIGNYAFEDCDGLTSVTIPNSVTSIGQFAFYDCSGLTSVTIGNSVTSIGSYAFYRCYSLASVSIGNSVTSIGDGAFSGCSGLTSVTIPNSVTSIGNSAFDGCSSLTAINVAAGNANYSSVEGVLFNKDQTSLIRYSGGKQGAYTIPNSVTSIGGSAFEDCSGLTSVTIPNSVTSIGRDAFRSCSGLTSVTIPNSVTSIGNYAFEYCSGLTSVTIPNSVTSIGNSAFNDCSGLTKVHISEIAAWCAINFNSNKANPLYYAHNIYLNGTLLTDLVIPNSITSIRNYAFFGCSSLTSIEIPNSVTSIGESAFHNCTSLTSVTIPNSVTSIGYRAFSGCNGLESVISLPNTPPTVSSSSFPNDVIVYVPNASLDSYKSSTNWKNLNIKGLCNAEISNAPTSVSLDFSHILWTLENNYISSLGIEGGEQQQGYVLEYIGLEPESEYKDVPIVLTSNTGETETVNVSFTTSALELTTKASKPVSSTTAILLAETNMSDAEVNCGFEYKRNDAPEDMAGTKVFCPVASGQMAGRLKNLKDDVYYKYRAFYQSAAGNMYYGDWQYIFTGDVAVEFDPILYTYGATVVRENEATISGYALAGSEDFTEQGFEYWAETRANGGTNAPRRMPAALNEHFFVQASGISLRVTLTDLDAGTVYKYRVYGKVGDQYYYGSEQAFTTTGTYTPPTYTITFANWDGTELQSSQVEEGTLPEYTGATPERPEDERYTYSFNGWTPTIVIASADATYTATYTATPKSQGIEDVQGNNVQCTKVLIDGTIFILRGEKVYNAQGALVK